jgi:hypothetical protein
MSHGWLARYPAGRHRFQIFRLLPERGQSVRRVHKLGALRSHNRRRFPCGASLRVRAPIEAAKAGCAHLLVCAPAPRVLLQGRKLRLRVTKGARASGQGACAMAGARTGTASAAAALWLATCRSCRTFATVQALVRLLTLPDGASRSLRPAEALRALSFRAIKSSASRTTGSVAAACSSFSLLMCTPGYMVFGRSMTCAMLQFSSTSNVAERRCSLRQRV